MQTLHVSHLMVNNNRALQLFQGIAIDFNPKGGLNAQWHRFA